ncbi:Pkinase-domain-containing protein [Didymella exigua CBS 183.55]|uniref:non-specific serine/threonine protein kinase n=1 Tax=Didymella exigua CBS 183.55 TaxID=1150837 RepID=A0A6A5RM28_9PLEO|nr:Pkinase-domain-containing protein [Didymella exigua CBS 183.55]KAF1928044.1 Pkinase-domain-containing protein [Didymella exigua CBS 183.55]
MASPAPEQPPQSVRFSDVNQEIEPESALRHVTGLTGAGETMKEPLSPQAEQELRNLSSTLQQSRVQAKRMENFSFEPVSLPPSRAPSPSPASRTTSGQSSQHRSSVAQAIQSPPLTPAGTSSRDDRPTSGVDHTKKSDPALMTPQISPPHEPPPTSMDSSVNKDVAVPGSPQPAPRTRPNSVIEPDVVQPHPMHGPSFTVGPAGDSLPASRDQSPSGSGGERTPGYHSPGTSTPTSIGRPFTPQGDQHDPYSRSKRAPQPKNLDGLDARFIFGSRDGRGRRNQSASLSSTTLPRSRGTASDKEDTGSNRTSIFGATGRPGSRYSSDTETDSKPHKHGHDSMSNLKRFFKIGSHKHKDKDKEKEKHKSPAPVIKREKPIRASKAGVMTPPLTNGAASVPFADDHGLESKYGKFGKVLGSGAGGSVRLMKRSSDGVTFAVKQFRARHSYESERDYNKKVTAEFCIGSTLHHGNIIETMDLVNEKGNYYVVMEYAPFDLFAIVMTGKMSREEMTCCTLQILNGVNYLHSMGLAHRDLKLDNVVVNEHGIMKIIDFGSAAVFRYPFENDVVLANGIVGSDPYLAPEVYDLSKYDPQPTDIWSLAIIFCCMTLRRFPWKAPRVSDNSYKLFVSPPNDGPKSITGPAKASTDLQHAADDHRAGTQSAPASRHPSGEGQQSNGALTVAPSSQSQQQPQVIKGPWRLLRLLPRESRHIIGRMLEVDPRRRATLEEIMNDKWVQNSQVCSQEDGGKVLRCDNHEHTLEPGAGASAPNTQQKK